MLGTFMTRCIADLGCSISIFDNVVQALLQWINGYLEGISRVYAITFKSSSIVYSFHPVQKMFRILNLCW